MNAGMNARKNSYCASPPIKRTCAESSFGEPNVSERIEMERIGVEPITSALQRRRSAN